MHRIAFGASLVVALACASALAQAPQPQGFTTGFTAQQIRAGAGIYERNCSPCHGARMLDPQGAFDLKKFPPDQHERFINSVAKGKNQMPPWGDLLKPEEIETLWAYVMAGGKN